MEATKKGEEQRMRRGRAGPAKYDQDRPYPPFYSEAWKKISRDLVNPPDIIHPTSQHGPKTSAIFSAAS